MKEKLKDLEVEVEEVTTEEETDIIDPTDKPKPKKKF